MKAWDFNCVIYDGDYYCNDCLPDGISVNDDDVSPVFASAEVESYPVCCECGEEHEYMNLIPSGEDGEEPEEES